MTRKLALACVAFVVAVALILGGAAPALADDGVDVSNWDGTINWTAVRAAGKTFAGVKQMEGTWQDPTYVRNVDGAHASGLSVWHYAFISSESGAWQADRQSATLHNLHAADVIVLDFEGAYATLDRAIGWAQEMRALHPSSELAIYMSSSVANGPINFQPVRNQAVSLCVANYGLNDGRYHGWPSTPAWGSVIAHQWTSVGRVPGISGDVDLDVTSGTRPTTTVPSPSGVIPDTGIVPDVRLAVDGVAGSRSVSRAQQLAGTPIDGVVSAQSLFARRSAPNLTSRTAGLSGSTFVRAFQRALGLPADAQWGPQTTRRLQFWLNQHRYGSLAEDGRLGPRTVAAWQRALNAGFLF
ncbi:MAG: GH25 family lysozyme [Pseudoclavibacter sp.]